jgi:hypothetical protein
MQLMVTGAHGGRMENHNPERFGLSAWGDEGEFEKVDGILHQTALASFERKEALSGLINKLSVVGRAITYTGFVSEGMPAEEALTTLFKSELDMLAGEKPANDDLTEKDRHIPISDPPGEVNVDPQVDSFYPITYGYNLSKLALSMAQVYLGKNNFRHNSWWVPRLPGAAGTIGDVFSEYSVSVSPEAREIIDDDINAEDNRYLSNPGSLTIGFSEISSVLEGESEASMLARKTSFYRPELGFTITQKSLDGHYAESDKINLAIADNHGFNRDRFHLVDFELVESAVDLGKTLVSTYSSRIPCSGVNKRLVRLDKIMQAVRDNS